MPGAYKTHRTSYIWLSGVHCVIGYPVDELNKLIDQYNKTGRWVDFWQFIEWETGEYVTGFSWWNDGNPLMNQLHTIKEMIS